MLVVHGKYSFARKLVAFRNDYCIACVAPRVAFQHRTFDVLHIFFIPLLPLGFWRRWHCATCGNDPHVNVKTRKSFKWVGTFLLGLMAAAFWFVPIGEIPPEDAALFQGLKFGLPIAFVIALVLTLRSKPDLDLKEKLREVRPAQDTTCPGCSAMLAPSERAWYCPQCGMRRLALAIR